MHMRKFALSVSIASLLFLGISAGAHTGLLHAQGTRPGQEEPNRPGQQPDQPSQPNQTPDEPRQQPDTHAHEATKMIAGTVTAIGNGGKSFAMDVNDGGDKKTMQFVVDGQTQVQGNVKVGTSVMVEYVADAASGQNLARTVTAAG